MISDATTASRLDSISGCILGTALGDAVGLKREGLSRDRAIWMHGDQPSPDLIFGRGYCSDDTEHTVMLGCAMLKSGGSVKEFEKHFASYLRRWLLSCPAGIGLGTLRSIVKSFFVGGSRSGVQSAGNGPAMRAGLIGLLAANDEHLIELAASSTRITHTDARAEEGALIVARAARFAYQNRSREPIDFIAEALSWIDGEEIRSHFLAMKSCLEMGLSPKEFAEERGWSKGPTGYINQTVPCAVYCWAHSPDDFRAVVSNAVLLGGDTDSIGAVAGAIAGAGCGSEALPQDWIMQLGEWPRDIAWMQNLAGELDVLVSKRESKDSTNEGSQSAGLGSKIETLKPTSAPSMRWGRTYIRNAVFAVTVIVLYFRRFIPIGFRKQS